jgi:TatD DNase family protein
MIDVHCHLQFHAFEKDYDEAIQRALAAGVDTIINTGTKLDSSEKAVAFAEQYENLFAIVGVHPHHADKHDLSSDWLKQLEKLTTHPKVIGIGECGMDYYRYQSNGIIDPKLQREIFEKQIELAFKANLLLQIHNRHAGEDVIAILRHHKSALLERPGMFHCFAGTREVLKDALELGFAIGFDGNLLYKGLAPGETVELRELAEMTPLDRLVVETDSPFLTPPPHRGKRNEPAYVILIARYLAELKHISLENLIEQTDKNVYTIFSKMKHHRQV